MEFRETLLAAQRNQQQKSSENNYYKARFDPPKKEQKSKDRLSSNIQKFLAKKEEEEQQKKLETLKKRDELLAMRDPKAMRKIQKSLKVFKSANKSVLDDAIDRDHTAVTREGELPDQDDYGYESQEAAAIYQKMMEKYSKVPDEPKFPVSGSKSKKDLDSTKERVKQALLHVDDPVPHKRRRRTGAGGTDDGATGSNREPSPPAHEPEKRPDKPKFRKPAPPPMDFNQLLKLAEQKKAEPLEVAPKKAVRPSESEPDRLMTKKQKREYEEEMARRMRRQERLDAEKAGGKKVQQREPQREERPSERERNQPSGFGRIPKIGERHAQAARNDSPKIPRNDSPKTTRNDSPKPPIRTDKEKVPDRVQKDRERPRIDKDRERQDKEKVDKERQDKEKVDKERQDRERLEKLKAERERIERDIERLNKDRERLEKTKMKLESSSRSSGDRPKPSKELDVKKNIELKSQNTYRIDKNSNEKKQYPNKSGSSMNGHGSQGRPVPKPQSKDRPNGARPDGDKKLSEPSRNPPPKGRPDQKPPQKSQVPSKPKIEAFDFDKAVGAIRNGQVKPAGVSKFPPGDVRRKMEDKRKQMMKRRRMESDSEYDSEMDDFIDDRDEDLDYSKHIKEIFGYDKSKYRDVDDEDDPTMESSFSRQMHEEFVSKKIGIMEDLEDIRLEKKMNKMKKKKRRISDD